MPLMENVSVPTDTPSTKPTVTVVIPAFNAARHVTAAIDSVLQQTQAGVEIIVVDDASMDNTCDVVQPYVERGQVKLVRHMHNKGVSGARNTAIRNGSGRYIAFLDADDLWLPHHLFDALGILERHEDVDGIFFNFDVVDMDTGAKLYNWFDARHEAIGMLRLKQLEGDTQLIIGGLVPALLAECLIHLQAMVIRRSACERVMFDERVCSAEDSDWAIRMAYLAHSQFAFNQRVSGIYRRHEKSLTSESGDKHELMARNQWLLFHEYLKWPDLAAEHGELLRRTLVKYGLILSYYARQRKGAREAFAFWYQSLRFGASKAHVMEMLKLVASLPKMLR